MAKKGQRTIKWYYNHRENGNGVVERQCSKCKEWLEENTDNYYLHNKSKPELGYNSECKRCAIKRSDAIQKKNPERTQRTKHEHYLRNIDIWVDRQREYNKEHVEEIAKKEKEWAEKNRERVREYSRNKRHHDITEREWKSCLQFFDNSCAYCGMTLEEHKKLNGHQLHKEHVDDEGYNDVRNCVPSCRSCNSTKKNKTIEQLFKLNIIDNFTLERYNKIMKWIYDEYKKHIEHKPPYRYSLSRIYNKDGSYKMQHELWTVDEKRNMLECIAVGEKKKDLLIHIEKYLKTLNIAN